MERQHIYAYNTSSAFVQKQGWRVSQLKGKYVTRLLTLIQAIWLKGTQEMYVNKKAYAFGGLDQTPKIDKLGSDGIQQFTFEDVGSVRHS